MTGKEYQHLAMRTNDGKAAQRLYMKLGWFYYDDTDFGGIVNACMGLSGEVGELTDMLKKWIFHEKDLDAEHLKKEVGDVLWYVAMMCQACGFDLDEIMQMNIDKLKARYPEGFDIQLANHRAEGDV